MAKYTKKAEALKRHYFQFKFYLALRQGKRSANPGNPIGNEMQSFVSDRAWSALCRETGAFSWVGLHLELESGQGGTNQTDGRTECTILSLAGF